MPFDDVVRGIVRVQQPLQSLVHRSHSRQSAAAHRLQRKAWAI